MKEDTCKPILTLHPDEIGISIFSNFFKKKIACNLDNTYKIIHMDLLGHVRDRIVKKLFE